MNSIKNYIFTSERLGFRNWTEDDIQPMADLNKNPNVMEFFPSIPTFAETKTFIEKMQQQFAKKNYCYFAVDVLESAIFIGFIGLSDKDFESDFTPCVDIGWRLSEGYWNKGYATEGAKACLEYGFKELKLAEIVAIAPKVNIKSEEVMKKIGMKKRENFNHPLLMDDIRLRECVHYSVINQPEI